MRHLFTSESVSEGHPDKMADQISDALLDNYLAFDKNSKVACETLVTTGQVVVAGEIKTNSIIDHDKIIRNVINDIGYNKSQYQFDAKSCGIFSALHSQSSDINQGVDRMDEKMQGAGDQGMMFGYASNETEDFMPISIDLSHKLLIELADVRRENDEIRYLRPDSKSQVTLEYKDGKPNRIDSIFISTQHDDFDNDNEMLKKIKSDMIFDDVLFNKLCFTIECKSHSSDSVMYDSNSLKVRYGKGWDDATNQAFQQTFSLKNYLPLINEIFHNQL